ncbi:fungal specific transcription factor [Aspergillus terreus]|uniref:Fungal specific transcription factor n=1 Tax=Aspergillus terreus TaxID=33178 RepID=A0A5M3Z7D2_ASPTE|nr:hypothetical protein ATETN484_0011012600 [Aspergillus terreus]GFF18763.1 fungal specific transcription factor [Aspergillus terreus]
MNRMDQMELTLSSMPADSASTERFQRIEARLDQMTTLLQETLPQLNALGEASYRNLQSLRSPGRRSDGSGQSPLSFRGGERDIPRKAWTILSNRYQSSELSLSFLQGTFLMAQLDFADGRSHRGYANVALGLRTLQSGGLTRDKYVSTRGAAETEARKRITWAFFMLDRCYNASRNYSLCLSDKYFTLPFPMPDPNDPRREEGPPPTGTLHDGPRTLGEKVDHGILACLIRLSAIWGKVTEYIFEPFDKSAPPPWRSGSAHATLESDWLHFETHFADTHRYMNVDFKRRAREEPQCHTYLSTWLCVQFLFHSTQGLLHHPFITMTKLRQMEGNIPSTFLQKSYESSLIHSRWIARFVREMTEVDWELRDPFIGYLCAIAATIQLEHTVRSNQQVVLQAKDDFRILVDFVTKASMHWPNMRVLVDRINKLSARRNNYGSLYYNQDGSFGVLPRMPTSSNIPRMSAEDEALVWDILDISSSSSFAEFPRLGDTLPQAQRTEGALMGSPDSSFMAAPHEIFASSADRRSSLAPQFPQGISPLPRVGPDTMEDGVIPEWPFTTREESAGLGPAMPDIPDWMLFGRYLPEQL